MAQDLEDLHEVGKGGAWVIPGAGGVAGGIRRAYLC